jgi:lipopolysaccharide transport system permease protein
MKARYREVRVQPPEAGRVVEVSCEVENGGPETWTPRDGYAFSYQIYDPASGSLVEDGRRIVPPGEVPPGKSLAVKMAVTLPPEPGDYRVFLSPLREHHAWFYEKGSEFLLLDARVENGRARVARQKIATGAGLRAEKLVRTVGRAFWYPFRALARHRTLIRSLVRRDIVGRYRGSYGGLFWTVIHPLLMMVTYYFVFGVVLRARFAGDDRPSSFVLYFLAGMLPWLAFSEALGRSPGVILEQKTFVKKLVFPVEILPANLAVAGLVSEAFGAAIFTAGLAYFERPFSTAMLWLPVLIVPQFFLTLGLCWFLAALGVFFRDIGQIIGFLLTLWFFLTPICYPVTSLPADWLWLFALNPLFVLVENYRRVLLEGLGPDWPAVARLAALSAVVYVGGFAWFYKLRRSFADLL